MKEYPTWMTENLNKCMCGSDVVLFYDESENYHVECTGCKSKVKYKASSTKHAKYVWNKRTFEIDYSVSTEEEARKRIKDYVDIMEYTYTLEELESSYQKYYMKGYYISYTLRNVIKHNEADCKLLFEGRE